MARRAHFPGDDGGAHLSDLQTDECSRNGRWWRPIHRRRWVWMGLIATGVTFDERRAKSVTAQANPDTLANFDRLTSAWSGCCA